VTRIHRSRDTTHAQWLQLKSG